MNFVFFTRATSLLEEYKNLRKNPSKKLEK